MHTPTSKTVSNHRSVFRRFANILRVRPNMDLNVRVFFENIKRVLNRVYTLAIDVSKYPHK